MTFIGFLSSPGVALLPHRCFLLLLVMAAILWKIKQKYDMFRRRQRLFVEMEQMASRPFSQVIKSCRTRLPSLILTSTK
jgi:hypothetical protein